MGWGDAAEASGKTDRLLSYDDSKLYMRSPPDLKKESKGIAQTCIRRWLTVGLTTSVG